MTKTRAMAIIGPALWNKLPPLTRTSLLASEPSASFCSCKTASSLFQFRTGSASDW